METAALVSVSEYLNSSYRPDQEMMEGRLVERNVGEYDHSNLQGALVAWLRQRHREWYIRVLPEQRLQVSATRFRVSRCVYHFSKAGARTSVYSAAAALH